jgi:hypothetical protein
VHIATHHVAPTLGAGATFNSRSGAAQQKEDVPAIDEMIK